MVDQLMFCLAYSTKLVKLMTGNIQRDCFEDSYFSNLKMKNSLINENLKFNIKLN